MVKVVDLSADDIKAYVQATLRDNYDLLPRLSTNQGVRLSQLFYKVYRQAYDRGYRVGQEQLARELNI